MLVSQRDAPVSLQVFVAQTCAGVKIVQMQKKQKRHKMTRALTLLARTELPLHWFSSCVYIIAVNFNALISQRNQGFIKRYYFYNAVNAVFVFSGGLRQVKLSPVHTAKTA